MDEHKIKLKSHASMIQKAYLLFYLSILII